MGVHHPDEPGPPPVTTDTGDGRFDLLSAMVDDAANRGAFRAAWVYEGRRATRSLLAHANTRPSRTASIRLLDAVQREAERRLARIARRYSFDLLQAIIRRIPPSAVSAASWLPIAIVEMERSVRDAPDTTLRRAQRSNALAAQVSLITIVSCFRLAALAALIADVEMVRRTVGKGGEFRPTRENPLHFTTSTEVRASLDSYDQRRQAEYQIFADQGVAVVERTPLVPGVVLLAWPLAKPMYYRAPERNLWLLANYLLEPVPMDVVWSTLEPYRRAVEHLHQVRLEDIAHVLTALTAKVQHTMRPFTFDAAGRPALESTGSPTDDDHRLGFTYSLLATASLRRELEEWIRELGEVSTPWCPETKEGSAATSRFFGAFTSTPGAWHERETVGTPRPLLVRGVAGTRYFDIGATGAWLGELLESAQGWFASQHGDHFHLAVRQLLSACPAIHAITPHWQFTDPNGLSRQGDLLVETREEVVVVECKAWRKPAAYLAGRPESLSTRRAAMTRAVGQVTEAANSLTAGTAFGVRIEDRRVEHVVCTPTPEFLHPVDRFGLLPSGVPRICTPAELIRHLERKGVDGRARRFDQ